MRNNLTIFSLILLLLTGCSTNSMNTDTNVNIEEKTMSNENTIEVIATIPDSDSSAEISTESVSAESDCNQKSQEELEGFYQSDITDEIFNRIYGKSYKENCTIPKEDLKYLHLLHKDLDGNIHEGEMIVNAAIAETVISIFEELYENNYPIEKIKLIDEYNADDELSMEDNNSSAFNFRYISHTTTVSNHGLGLAIDINPLYNPYTKMVGDMRSIEPINAEPYLDREKDFPYKIDENDLAYKLFIKNGFEWGGNWTHSKDYQHFEFKLK